MCSLCRDLSQHTAATKLNTSRSTQSRLAAGATASTSCTDREQTTSLCQKRQGDFLYPKTKGRKRNETFFEK